LRLEISCESDKKKMNFIFNYDKKILLTAKMKRVSRGEKEKQRVEEISGVSQNGFSIAATNASLLHSLRIPS